MQALIYLDYIHYILLVNSTLGRASFEAFWALVPSLILYDADSNMQYDAINAIEKSITHLMFSILLFLNFKL